ncbi:MAG: PAS domain S-box protein [Chloroflexi bacterium]|nr:PAS domain S-box protein [Chloroflexota bacterium]
MSEITHLDAGDQRLKESIQRYRRMVQTVQDGVMVLDAGNNLLFANEQLAEMLGCTVESLLGEHLSTLVLDGDFSGGADGQRRPRLTVSEQRELQFRHAEGAEIWGLVRSTPLFDAEGEFCGVRASVSDITALKRAEAEVSRLREQIESRSLVVEQRVQERTLQMEDFVATVSHEFRTPLTSVRGYVDLMLSDPALPPEQREKYLMRLLANAEHLTNLLNNLLDLSRIAEGHIQLDLRPVPLRDVLSQLEEAMTPQFHDKRIDFMIELGALPTTTFTLVTDRESLIRILSNLLSNACKYTPAGGVVSLQTELVEGDTVWFMVTDSGVGIPLSEQGRIFSKFYRGSNTRRLPTRGTGLGLAITKSLVELLGGEIGFVSQEDAGTVFRVSLPLAPELSKASASDSSS